MRSTDSSRRGFLPEFIVLVCFLGGAPAASTLPATPINSVEREAGPSRGSASAASPRSRSPEANKDGRHAELIVGRSGRLAEGEGKTFELPIDPTITSVGVAVDFYPETADLVVKLLNPAGRSETLVRGAEPAIPSSFRFERDKPAIGIWRVEVLARTALIFSYEARADTTLRIRASTEKENYAFGEPIPMTARIELSENPVAGARVEAWVFSDSDQPIEFQTANLSDAGDGNYGGAFVSTMDGTFGAEVVARGAVSGYAYQRACYIPSIGVIPDTVKIIGAHLARPIDANGNGPYHNLVFEIDLDLREAGNYLVVGHLSTGEGVLIKGSTESFDLKAGRQTIRIAFDGKEIMTSGKDGRYRLSKLIIWDMQRDAAPPIEKQDLCTTPPFKHDQFE